MTSEVDTSEVVRTALVVIREQIEQGIAAKKCHGCGCFQQTVNALAEDPRSTSDLAARLVEAKGLFIPKKYDCLGCDVCFPAVAANAFVEAYPDAAAGLDLCPTEEPSPRPGWPPLPGDFVTLSYAGSVAVCTLNSTDLTASLAAAAPQGVAVVGNMHTENLGIERLIQNVVSNPNVRFLVLCGEDTQQAVGHLPGQSLSMLSANGLDEDSRIIGARGKRPYIKNVGRDMVEAFRRQVELLPMIGETDVRRIVAVVQDCTRRSPGPFGETVSALVVEKVQGAAARRLIQDPAGYFVIYPDGRTRTIAVEHFTNAGVLDLIIEGATATALYGTIIDRGLVSRLDHAAYLGKELARAAAALDGGEPYVQDRAPGEIERPQPDTSCGCTSGCGTR